MKKISNLFIFHSLANRVMSPIFILSSLKIGLDKRKIYWKDGFSVVRKISSPKICHIETCNPERSFWEIFYQRRCHNVNEIKLIQLLFSLCYGSSFAYAFLYSTSNLYLFTYINSKWEIGNFVLSFLFKIQFNVALAKMTNLTWNWLVCGNVKEM